MENKVKKLLILHFSLFLAMMQAASLSGQARNQKSVSQAEAEQKTADSYKPHWRILVTDLIDPQQDRLSTNWTTVYSDGNQTENLPGFVISMGGFLRRLEIETIENTVCCPDDKFPFRFEVDQLIAVPLSRSDRITSEVLLGRGALLVAREDQHYHLDSCDEFSKEDVNPRGNESFEIFRVKLLSIYSHYLGVETILKSMGLGNHEVDTEFDWSPIRIGEKLLSRGAERVIDKSHLAKAKERYQAHVTGLGHKVRFDADSYTVIPKKGGALVKFGMASGKNPGGNILEIDVDVPEGLLGDYDAMRAEFVKNHPNLIPWNACQFYTVAPDRSAIVYAVDGILFWQPVDGEVKEIATLKNFRGWQWHSVF